MSFPEISVASTSALREVAEAYWLPGRPERFTAATTLALVAAIFPPITICPSVLVTRLATKEYVLVPRVIVSPAEG
jgi:hypothetical protein